MWALTLCIPYMEKVECFRSAVWFNLILYTDQLMFKILITALLIDVAQVSQDNKIKKNY